MLDNIGGALTRKIGPLPAWGWGIGIGGAILAARYLRAGSGGGGNPKTILVPTGGPTAAPDFVSELGDALDEIRDRLSNLEDGPDDGAEIPAPGNPPPTNNDPSKWWNRPGDPLGTFVIGLRQRYPEIYQRYLAQGGSRAGTPGVYPNESDSARTARLLAERAYFESQLRPSANALADYWTRVREWYDARRVTGEAIASSGVEAPTSLTSGFGTRFTTNPDTSPISAR